MDCLGGHLDRGVVLDRRGVALHAARVGAHPDLGSRLRQVGGREKLPVLTDRRADGILLKRFQELAELRLIVLGHLHEGRGIDWRGQHRVHLLDDDAHVAGGRAVAQTEAFCEIRDLGIEVLRKVREAAERMLSILGCRDRQLSRDQGQIALPTGPGRADVPQLHPAGPKPHRRLELILQELVGDRLRATFDRG